MMGSTIKLLGLTSLNVFVALALSASYLTHYSGRLQMLTEDSASAFIREFSNVTSGQRGGMDENAVPAYLMQHVADDGIFTVTFNSKISGLNKSANTMKKKEFIVDTEQTILQKGPHPASFKVENLKIGENGRTATALVTVSEKSAMEVKNADDGKSSIATVSATSYCEESIRLSNERIIQMQSQNCSITVVPVDSF